MRNHEIESWTLDVIERVVTGQPVEDSRVELKSKWPPPIKAARRIAGHANAAHGEEILWLIGVDEKNQSVPGVDRIEFSNWWAQTAKHFSELAPELTDLVVPSGGVSVMAIVFQTSRAPFVVNNPNPGDAIPREVPYRQGTRVDSATRSQLLQLLSSMTERASLEILSCSFTFAQEAKGRKIYSRCAAYVFIVQPQGHQAVMASHRSRAYVSHSQSEFCLKQVGFGGNLALSIEIVGPGHFSFVADEHMPEALAREFMRKEKVTLRFEFKPPNSASPITACIELHRNTEDDSGTLWDYDWRRNPLE